MIQKLLHAFVAQETLALIEKVNATDSTSDSSFQAAGHLLHHGKFNFVERKLLAKALKKVARRETLVGAMNVVVYNNIEGEVHDKAQQSMLYSTTLGMRGDGGTAAQNAWERQLNQTSILGQQQNYAQQLGVLR
jgi:hypothetical protein